MVKKVYIHKVLSIVLLLLFYACSSQKKEKTTLNIVTNSEMDTTKKYVMKELDTFSSKNIMRWKEYFNLRDFLKIYQEISSREALNNALELKGLTKLAKDSINIKELKIASFKARLNVFQNEVLRLADMTYIPAISVQEIDHQVKSVFSTFNSINSKIEHTFKKKSFDNSMELQRVFEKDD